MLSPAVSTFLSKAAVETALSTSLAGIFQYEEPKATAAATFAALVCRKVIHQLPPTDYTPVNFAVPLIISCYVGSQVGQRFNKNFSYINLALSEGLAIWVIAIVAAAAGIKTHS